METTPAPAYQFEVTSTHGDATPAAFFVTLAEATTHCREVLGGFINRTDDRPEQAELVPNGESVRFRGPQGLRWVKQLGHAVPVGTAAPRFNPGQPARIFGVERRLYVQARYFAFGTWQYTFQGFIGIYAEALVFGPYTEPTPPSPAGPAAQVAPEPEPEPEQPEPQPLLFSLHSTKLASEAQGQPTWRELPPRLFLKVRTTRPESARIAALCGTTGSLFTTSSYNVGPFKLESGQELATVQELGSYFTRQFAAMIPAEGAAMLLETDGTLTELRPTKGKTFKLKQLYKAIGCEYIEVLAPQHGPYQGYIMVIDEEGKHAQRAINPLATAIWYETYPVAEYSPVDVVVGPVLLMKSELLK
jgi:hypothetical protein